MDTVKLYRIEQLSAAFYLHHHAAVVVGAEDGAGEALPAVADAEEVVQYGPEVFALADDVLEAVSHAREDDGRVGAVSHAPEDDGRGEAVSHVLEVGGRVGAA
jgi:hypothetical protein